MQRAVSSYVTASARDLKEGLSKIHPCWISRTPASSRAHKTVSRRRTAAQLVQSAAHACVRRSAQPRTDFARTPLDRHTDRKPSTPSPCTTSRTPSPYLPPHANTLADMRDYTRTNDTEELLALLQTVHHATHVTRWPRREALLRPRIRSAPSVHVKETAGRLLPPPTIPPRPHSALTPPRRARPSAHAA